MAVKSQIQSDSFTGIFGAVDFCHPVLLGKLPSCFATDCRLFLDLDRKTSMLFNIGHSLGNKYLKNIFKKLLKYAWARQEPCAPWLVHSECSPGLGGGDPSGWWRNAGQDRFRAAVIFWKGRKAKHQKLLSWDEGFRIVEITNPTKAGSLHSNGHFLYIAGDSCKLCGPPETSVAAQSKDCGDSHSP